MYIKQCQPILKGLQGEAAKDTGVRRETAGAYLKAAGIGVRPPGAWGRRPPAKPANENEVTTGSDATKPTPTVNPNPNPENLSTRGKAKARTAKPANENAVTTGFGVELSASERKPRNPVPSTSLCEPFREAIELGLSQGRNSIGIWQDLVSESGFDGGYQTVKRFVRKLRGNRPPQPRAVIITAPHSLAVAQGGPDAAEFQKILDHSGLVWSCWTGALAHLGVARANALQSRTLHGPDADAARVRALAAYQTFLALWKYADPDIPILKQAKAEYAKLQ